MSSDFSGFLSRRQFLQMGAATISSFLLPSCLTNSNDRVVIVGAGISGLSAAHQLVYELGYNAPNQVILLEARNRIGGRIHTDSSSLSAPIELGAGWIHGITGNPITQLANQYGATLFPTNYNAITVFDVAGSPIPTNDYNDLYVRYQRRLAQFKLYRTTLTEDQSIANSLSDIHANAGLTPYRKRVMQWHYYWNICADYMQDTQQLSTLSFDQDSMFPGVDKLFPNGYSQITSGLASGLDIRLNHVVSQINYTNPLIEIVTNQGTFLAEKCIVTLPLGVLKAGSVQFSPTLPNTIQNAISGIGFGIATKVALQFPSIFWDNSQHFLGKIGAQNDDYGNGEHAEILNVGRFSNQPVLVFYTGQEYALALEAMSLTEATERVMQDLRLIYGNNIPDPVAATKTDWATSPYTSGAYSYWAVNSTLQDTEALASPVNNRLFFAGEHTIVAFPGTVHGAYLSGQRAALQVANQ